MYEMVLLGNKKLAKKFNGKRVGQAGNANAAFAVNNANGLMANANLALNANAYNANAGGYNGLATPVFNGMLDANIDVSNPTNDVLRNLQAFEGGHLSENQSLNAIERQSGLDIDIAIDEDTGDRVLVATDELSGAQVTANIPAPQQQQQFDDNVCEFPAQSVQLARNVFITNTTPQIVDVQTDICGNVVSYTESMTRNMNATEWRATNPSELNGPVRAFSVNNQGTIINGSGNVRLANSSGLNGFSAPQQVVSQQLVGGRRMHMSNKNASFGAAKMSQWKGA